MKDDLHQAEATAIKACRHIKKGGVSAKSSSQKIRTAFAGLAASASTLGLVAVHSEVMAKVDALAQATTKEGIQAAYVELMTAIPTLHEKAAEVAGQVRGEDTVDLPENAMRAAAIALGLA